MAFSGKHETWKVVYIPVDFHSGTRGVALVEACDRQHAMYTFNQQYSGQYRTVESCTKLLG